MESPSVQIFQQTSQDNIKSGGRLHAISEWYKITGIRVANEDQGKLNVWKRRDRSWPTILW